MTELLCESPFGKSGLLRPHDPRVDTVPTQVLLGLSRQDEQGYMNAYTSSSTATSEPAIRMKSCFWLGVLWWSCWLLPWSL